MHIARAAAWLLFCVSLSLPAADAPNGRDGPPSNGPQKWKPEHRASTRGHVHRAPLPTSNSNAAVESRLIEPPPVRIEAITVNDQPVIPSDALRIQSSCRKLEIRYSVQPVDNPGETRFRCRLDQLDTNWIEVGSQRFAIFSHLPPGKYKFRVTASHGTGAWHPTGAVLSLTVTPGLFRSAWFRAALVSAVLAALYCPVRFRRMRQRRQLLEQERTRIAQDMHDHVGARLTHIALISEQVRREPNLAPALVERIDKISVTTRDVAQTLDEIVWAVEPSNDTIEGVIDYLSRYCCEQAAAAGVELKQDLPETIPAGSVPSIARHNLVLAVKEALNNSVKHALATEIELRIQLAGYKLRVQITDNGRGFLVEASRAVGNGLRNMEKRLTAAGGECRIDSVAGGGTRVAFDLPLRKPAFSARSLLLKNRKGFRFW